MGGELGKRRPASLGEPLVRALDRQPEPERDSLDVTELGVLERIESLQVEERRASLDAFVGDERARKEGSQKAAKVADHLTRGERARLEGARSHDARVDRGASRMVVA